MDIDATNTYAEDPPIDKIFFDYVDDQYRYFHRDRKVVLYVNKELLFFFMQSILSWIVCSLNDTVPYV